MRKSTLPLLLAVAASCWTVVAAAASLPLETLPANARWVLQLDAQALRDSPLGKELLAAMDGTPAAAELSAFEAVFACDVRHGLAALTACGAGGAEQGGVVYLRGKWNLRTMSAVLDGSHACTTLSYGRHTILRWNDAKAPEDFANQSVCLLSSNLVLLANREAALRQALDVLDGKAPTLASALRFRRMAAMDTNAFLRVAAVELQAIVAEQPLAAVLPPIDSLRLAVTSDGQEARLKAVLQTDAPESARQLQQVLAGFQAVLLLQGMKKPEIGKLAQAAHIDVSGQDVSVVLTASFDTLKRLLFQHKKNAAPSAPPLQTRAPTPAPAADW